MHICKCRALQRAQPDYALFQLMYLQSHVCVRVQQSMVGKHESVEKLLADLEQRNAAARESGVGQDMTVDVVVRPCEVAQTIQDMVTKSRPRSLIAPAPTLPTISPPLPEEEEEQVEEPEPIAVPEPTVLDTPKPSEPIVEPIAERSSIVSPVPQPQQAQGPNSSLRRAEGNGKEIMLQVCDCTLFHLCTSALL